MRILVKFPIRARREKFFKTFDLYHSMAGDIHDMSFLVTCDTDDECMNNEETLDRIRSYRNTIVEVYDNKNKVEAINRGIPKDGYDIILLASDDMIPEMRCYDANIRAIFRTHFPDTDGVAWFNDGLQRNNLNTLCILGRKYYERFGYIYHPSYVSLWADNEFTQVSLKLKKTVYINYVIIRHCHPSLSNEKDGQNFKDDKFIDADRDNFLKRMKEGFR
jgi:hypothetical protein